MIRDEQMQRLTDRELDILARRIGAEIERRMEQRRRQRREERRRERLELTSITSEERARKYTHGGAVSTGERRPPERGHGGLVIAIDRRRKIRIVQCTTCDREFEFPLKRGRAPRECGTCRG